VIDSAQAYGALMAWAERNGVRLYTERRGEGPPLLYISGTGADLRNHPGPFDGAFGRRFDLVSYDQRGLGQSDQPPPPYSMADYGDDAAAVLDAEGLDAVAVIGVSFGGMVAQELVLRHPDRVTRLVLACTSSGGAGGASYPLHELIDLEGDDAVATRLAITDTRWASSDADDPIRTDTERGLRRAGPITLGARAQLEARRHHDTYARLGEISIPVFVCGGRYDGIAPPANVEALAKAIPGAAVAFYEGGHRFLAQDPAATPAVIEFLLD
jgi:3-oxoadipate enol-lactonase